MNVLVFLLPFLVFALADPQPAAVTPCTVGFDAPCLPSSTCTPTMISTSGQPWLGQCIATPTPYVSSPMPTITYGPPTSTECMVGWATGCNTGSTCTPTMTCQKGRPCGGACIATITPTPTPSPSAECMVGWTSQCNTGSTCTPIETCYRLRPCSGKCIATPTPPSTTTECHVGWGNECNTGSTCTPTMTCQQGRPCGGACIATPTPVPTPSGCSVGWESQCNTGSTCTPTMTCHRGRPCGGACIAIPTPLPPSSSPPVVTPPTTTECHVGWPAGECNTGSTCTPTMTCVRGRPCGGACIATAGPTPSSSACRV